MQLMPFVAGGVEYAEENRRLHELRADPAVSGEKGCSRRQVTQNAEFCDVC